MNDDISKQFARFTRKIEKALRRDAPRVAGKEAVRLFKQNFMDEGFFGKRWKEVQRRRVVEMSYRTKKGRRRTKYRTKGKGAYGKRRILTGRTGNLGRSISSIPGVGWATVIADAPYSAVHNEGLRAGRGKGFAMPRRQFMGDHRKLQEALAKKIESEIIRKLR